MKKKLIALLLCLALFATLVALYRWNTSVSPSVVFRF